MARDFGGTGDTGGTGRATGPQEPVPLVGVDPVVRTGAGRPVALRVTVTNTATTPRAVAVHAMGVDPDWLPLPVRTAQLLPGEHEVVELVLTPALGTLPARYPLSVVVQALDPTALTATSVAETAALTLVVDAPSEVGLALDPSHVVTTFGRKVEVVVTNDGDQSARVTLALQAPREAGLRLPEEPLVVDPRSSATVAGTVRRRPRLVGSRVRHAYVVTAHTSGAPTSVDGSVTLRPVLGASLTKAVAIVTLVALWVVAAAVAVPRLAEIGRQSQSSSAAAGPAGAADAAGAAGGADGAGGGAAGSGPGASGAAGAEGKAAAADGVRLNGTVSGADPRGVTVSLRPTSLVDESVQGATVVGSGAGAAVATRGLVPSAALSSAPPGSGSTPRATTTREDGAWSFPAVTAPGYYLLTFAKPGYQVQRYVIDSAQADATQPLAVTLAAGQGRLSGSVTGPSGPVGGGRVSISDGVNTLTTSTDSVGSSGAAGAPGTWRVDGLSTPSTYLVSVSKDGLGAESSLVSLDAGGSSAVRLALRAGVAALTGLVQGVDDRGTTVGLGGVTVTAVSDGVTHSATTVTQGPVGRYTLPGLTPGRWAVTVEADGYQPQTQSVVVVEGQSFAVAGAVLTRSTASVAGTVADLTSRTGQEGAGIILTSPGATYKTLTGAGGSFTVNGIAAGTYVLSAALFGYTTAYATVTLAAGRMTRQDVVLRYLGQAGLPSTAQVRVAGLLDAASGGPLSCTTASGDPQECVVTIATDPGASTTWTDTFRTGDIGPEGYVVPSVPDPPPDPLALLQPGLHRVRVSVPGYESVTVPVQVPIGATATPTVTATVPTLSMYPVPRLLGTVTAVVGTPTGLVMQATEVGGAGFPAVSAPVDPTTGAYELELPEHGTYEVSVVTPPLSEYRTVPATPVTLALGEVRRYDATVHRRGQVVVTVLAPDPATGQLAARPGASVTVTGADGGPVTDDAGRRIGPVTSDANGVALLTRFDPGLYRVRVQGGSQGPVPTDGLPVGDDQSPAVTVVLTSAVTQVVGRVVSQVSLAPGGATEDTAVAGATVTVSGTVGFSGSAPDVRSVTATSDGTGCFAVTPTGSPPQALGVCTAVTGDAVRALGLVTGQASVAVTADGYQPLVLGNRQVDGTTLLTAVLTPKPSTFAGSLTFQPVRGNDPGLGVPTISVVRPAVGSGRVSITADAAGRLTWVDSNFGTPGAAWPGVYEISATSPGYATATATVTCPLAVTPEAGACVLGPFVIKQLGTLVLQAATGPSTAPTVLAGASFTLTGNGAAPQTQSAPAGSTQVTFTGISPDPDPAYVVRVQAGGYAFADTTTLPVSCTGGPDPTGLAVSPSGTTSCTVLLTPLATISGTTYGVLAATGSTPRQPLGGVALVARRCAGATVTPDGSGCDAVATDTGFTAVSGSDGGYAITGTAAAEGLQDGWWEVSSSAAGYTSPTPSYVHVVGGEAVTSPTDVNLRVLPVTLEVGVQNSSSSAAADLVRDATVVLTDASGRQLTQSVAQSGTNLFRFTGLVPTTYSLNVTGPSINLVNLQVSLVVGVATQTIYVRTDVTASIVSGTVSAVQGADPATTALAGASVDVGTGTGPSFTVLPGVDGADLHTTTDPAPGRLAGFFTFSTVPDGTFVVRVSHPGYVTGYRSVTVAHGVATASLDVVLTRVAHAVRVTLVSTNGFSLAGVPVTLTPVGGNPAQGAQALGSVTDPAVTAPATAWGAVFNTVPFGTWTVGVGLRSGTHRHYGTLVPVAPSDDLTVVVGPDDTDGDAVARFSLTEGQLDLSVTARPWPTETTPAPATIALSVTAQGAATPTFVDASFATRSDTDTEVTSIWLPPGPWLVTATPSVASRPAYASVTSSPAVRVTSSSTPVDGGLDLVEQPSGLDVVVTLDGRRLTTPAQLTLAALDGQTVPAEYATPRSTTTGGAFTFDALPPGRWRVTAVVGGSDPATAEVTLVAGASGSAGGGGSTTINVRTARLAVVVTRGGGALTTQASLTLAAGEGQTVPPAYRSPVTTVAGAFTFSGLPAGVWAVTATLGAKSATSPDVTLVVGASGDHGDGQPVPIDIAP